MTPIYQTVTPGEGTAPASDAIIIDSSHLNAAEMLEKALKEVTERLRP
jgi:cytidylate kinase